MSKGDERSYKVHLMCKLKTIFNKCASQIIIRPVHYFHVVKRSYSVHRMVSVGFSCIRLRASKNISTHSVATLY